LAIDQPKIEFKHDHNLKKLPKIYTCIKTNLYQNQV